MKVAIIVISLASVVLIFNACCYCTEKACMTLPVGIKLNTSLNDYEKRELTDLLIIQTNQDFQHLDTIAKDFVPLEYQSSNYETNIIPTSFETIKEVEISNALKAFNYIIVNPTLQRTDTIQDIQYEVKQEKRVCNECRPKTLCADEYFTYNNYSNPSIRYNGKTINSFTIDY